MCFGPCPRLCGVCSAPAAFAPRVECLLLLSVFRWSLVCVCVVSVCVRAFVAVGFVATLSGQRHRPIKGQSARARAPSGGASSSVEEAMRQAPADGIRRIALAIICHIERSGLAVRRTEARESVSWAGGRMCICVARPSHPAPSRLVVVCLGASPRSFSFWGCLLVSILLTRPARTLSAVVPLGRDAHGTKRRWSVALRSMRMEVQDPRPLTMCAWQVAARAGLGRQTAKHAETYLGAPRRRKTGCND